MSIYSNCDHTLEEDVVEEAKRTGEKYQHAAWNFCGYVRFDIQRQVWVEEIWVNRCQVETLEDKDLRALISAVNERFGSE